MATYSPLRDITNISGSLQYEVAADGDAWIATKLLDSGVSSENMHWSVCLLFRVAELDILIYIPRPPRAPYSTRPMGRRVRLS